MEMAYDYSKILVTGGAGFIGSHLVDRLLTHNVEVAVLDNFEGGKFENVSHHAGKKNFRLVRGDIRNYRLVNKLIRDVDAVFHQAALISVPQSIKNPVLVNEVNVNGTLNLLKASVNSNVRRFIYASSCAVYGNVETMPINEGHQLRPINPYGVSKMAAENYVRVFHKVYGLETVCLRYFNVYGPRQIHNQYSGVITQFLNSLTSSSSLKIFGDGKQTRDFIHVQNVVEANLLALKTNNVAGETFNIGTGTPNTINQLAKILLEIAGNPHIKLVHLKPRKGDIKNSVADISKAKEKLHYAPQISLREGLTELVKSLE